MKVKDVMTVDVKSCRPETNAAEAVKMMWDQDCGALPIVNNDRKVVGMITDRDLSVAVATRGHAAERIAVKDVATGKAYTCQVDDDVPAALEVMKAQQVRRLSVVDAQGRLKGILSNDIVLHSGAASPNQIVDSLAGICAHRRKAAVAGAA
jgi:CBS domain-containing protein